MNVLLVNTPSNGIYYKMGLKLPPLGVAYLAAYLRKNGKYSVLTPFPGTALYKQAEDENLIATRDWSKYDGAHAVMNTHYMSQKEIIWSFIKAYLSFYGRPSRWWEVLSGTGKALLSIR